MARPQRESLDGLRGRLSAIFEREGAALFPDPWAARDRFIELVLDPERADAPDFLARQAGRRLDEREVVTALRLLEMQRQAMLMYTSCGWFFAEISGLETVQVMKYAARAMQLAQEAAGADLEPIFKDALARAPSNIPEVGDGARAFERFVRPSVVSLEGVAAHYAISSLFDGEERSGRIFSYRYDVRARRNQSAGPATLSLAHLELMSAVTRERLDTTSCVLHFGGSDFRCGLGPFADAAHYAEVERALFERLETVSLSELVREIDAVFTGRDYTLRDLFIDERRRLAARLLQETLRRYEQDYLDIFESNRRLMEFLREISSPVPPALRVAASFALTHELLEILGALEEHEDVTAAHAAVLSVIETAERLGVRLDVEAARPSFDRLMASWVALLSEKSRAEDAQALIEVVDVAERLGLTLDLWAAQNALWTFAAYRCALDSDEVARLARRFWFDEATLISRASRPETTAASAPSQPTA